MRHIPRGMWLLAAGVAVNSLGFAFMWPLTAIYVHRVLGQPMTVVGVLLTAQAGAGLLGSFWGGVLFDRFGARRPLLVAVAVNVMLMAWIGLDRNFWVYAVGATFAGMGVGVVFPCLNALAAQLWPGAGRNAFNVVYVAQNAGVAFGSILGGLVASIGFQFTFFSAAMLLATFWVLIAVAYRGTAFDRPPAPEAAVGRRLRAHRVPLASLGSATWLLAAGLMLDWVAYVQWQSTTPNYMQAEGLALPLYSLLWTINGGLILLGQPLVLAVVRWLPRAKTQILVGNALFLLAFLLLAGRQAYPVYVAAMALSTLGEMLVWPAVPAAADQWAPPGRRGTVQGLISMAGSVGRMAGPLLGGILYVAIAPAGLFLIMAAIFVGAGLVYLVYDRLGRNPDIRQRVDPTRSAEQNG
jgi:MFS family permease